MKQRPQVAPPPPPRRGGGRSLFPIVALISLALLALSVMPAIAQIPPLLPPPPPPPPPPSGSGEWSPGTPITVSIMAPSDGMVAGPGTTTQCTAIGSDLDQCLLNGMAAAFADTLTYTWSASEGAFPNGNTGATVNWQAPAEFTNNDDVVIICTADDVATVTPPATGSRDDAPAGDMISLKKPLCEVSFIGSGTLGGIAPIKLEVVTRGCIVATLALDAQEQTELHECPVIHVTNGPPAILETSSTTDGVTTAVYRVNWTTTTTHNGPHALTATVVSYLVGGLTGQLEAEAETTRTVKNVTIETVTPAPVVGWDGTPSTTIPITVELADNDLNDLMNVTLKLYDTGVSDATNRTPIRTMVKTGVTGAMHVFNWDGKDDAGEYVDPWTYAYNVEVSQQDQDNEYPELQITDGIALNSPYLSILRALDENGQPILDVEFEAQVDNGTPDDASDDVSYYYIRWYALKDAMDADAEAGRIWLYDSEMQLRGSWDVASLECALHDAQDGLTASSTGSTHGLYLGVPTALFDKGGTYLFVLECTDGHAIEYRDHRDRQALALNSKTKPQVLYVYLDSLNWGPIWSTYLIDWPWVEAQFREIGVRFFQMGWTEGEIETVPFVLGGPHAIKLLSATQIAAHKAFAKAGEWIAKPNEEPEHIVYDTIKTVIWTGLFVAPVNLSTVAQNKPPRPKFWKVLQQVNVHHSAGAWRNAQPDNPGICALNTLQLPDFLAAADIEWADRRYAATNIALHEITHAASERFWHCAVNRTTCAIRAEICEEFKALLYNVGTNGLPWCSLEEIRDIQGMCDVPKWRQIP